MTDEQAIYASRVLTFNTYSYLADEDIQENILLISQGYQELRDKMCFDEAAFISKSRWLQSFIKKGCQIPTCKIGTVKSLKWLTNNVDPTRRLTAITKDGLFDLALNLSKVKTGENYLAAVEPDGGLTFTAVEENKQTIGHVRWRGLKLTAVQDEGQVTVKLPNGNLMIITDIGSGRGNEAVCSLANYKAIK